MKPSLISPPLPNNFLYYLYGILFLLLSKAKFFLQGYRSPRPKDISDIETAIEYDLNVYDNWSNIYKEYTGRELVLDNLSVLELGPGDNLGIGLITLFNGAKKYSTLDVNNLIGKSFDLGFYDSFFNYLTQRSICSSETVELLRAQVNKLKRNEPEMLNYSCRSDFDLMEAFKYESFDIVFSQAAFEHFNDFNATVEQLSSVVGDDAYLIAEVDLSTHSRFIREIDPLSIYRYPDVIYNLITTSASPNRLRPFEYEEILERHGWEQCRVFPLSVYSDEYCDSVRGALLERYQDKKNQIEFHSIALCARKAPKHQ